MGELQRDRIDKALGLTDQIIECVDCGASFTFTIGESKFYRDRGLVAPPTRCKPCRLRRRYPGGYTEGVHYAEG